METIEERAKSYAMQVHCFRPDLCAADYIAGAKEEHILLTEWYDVKDKFPDTDRRVLVKTTQDGILMACYGLTHTDRWFVYGFMQGQMPEVTHWREIHE